MDVWTAAEWQAIQTDAVSPSESLEAQQVEIMALNSRMTQMEGMMTEVVTRLRQLTMHPENP